jgi:MoaA/NifB/PqqE/SkfB family radical SAM enzyme
VADQLAAAGVDKVLISGGEPLLHPAVEPVMRRLSEAGVLVKLLTNGTVPHQAAFDLIRESKSIEVSLSVPTVDPRQADEIFRAEGTLDRIAATIAELPAARLNVICAVSRANVAGVEAVVDWVADRGVPCLSLTDIFKDPVSRSRFRDDCRDLRIDADQRRDLFELIARKRAQYSGRLAIRTTQFVHRPQEVCMAGKTVFYLDALGTLSPCTVTDNAPWRTATAGMTVGEAIAYYRETLEGPPHSSCSAHLAAIRLQQALAGS